MNKLTRMALYVTGLVVALGASMFVRATQTQETHYSVFIMCSGFGVRQQINSGKVHVEDGVVVITDDTIPYAKMYLPDDCMVYTARHKAESTSKVVPSLQAEEPAQ